ncbi:MAG: MFS transporter [Pseudomonadota bacterium]
MTQARPRLAQATTLAFIAGNARWLAAGTLLNFLTSFGQTFFLSLFGGEVRAAFGLSHGAYGNLYMFGTLLSAAVLIWLGRLADQVPLYRIGGLTIIALAGACAAMALTTGPISLFIAFFLLRIAGQGMMSHVSLTAMTRAFDAHRGRALGLTALGFPLGQILLPAAAVALSGAVGWRQVWWLSAAALVMLGLPALLALLRRSAAPGDPVAPSVSQPSAPHRKPATPSRPDYAWTRREVVRHALFWLLQPALLAPAFIFTAIFFHQAHLVETKGWTMSFWALLYTPFATATVVASLATGWAIDRFGARAVLPFLLLPMAISLVLLATGTSGLMAGIALVCFGGTSGAMQPIVGAILAELYGTRHLGAIRALQASAMVFSSALGPGVMGILMDAGITMDAQIWVMALYSVAASVVSAWALHRNR